LYPNLPIVCCIDFLGHCIYYRLDKTASKFGGKNGRSSFPGFPSFFLHHSQRTKQKKDHSYFIFSMAYSYKIVLHCFLMVCYGMSHFSLAFSWYTHLNKGSKILKKDMMKLNWIFQRGGSGLRKTPFCGRGNYTM